MADQPGQDPTSFTVPPRAYAPTSAQRNNRTVWTVVIAVAVLAVLGCCVGLIAMGGLTLLASADPTDSIDAINQAAIDGDTTTFEMYFDVDAVIAAAYESILASLRDSEDYRTIVEELGEDEAERIVREEVLPADEFAEGLSESFSVEDPDGGVPFPNYTVQSRSVSETEAELTIATNDENDGEVTFVLGFVKEEYEGESVWRLKEIKNIADIFGQSEQPE